MRLYKYLLISNDLIENIDNEINTIAELKNINESKYTVLYPYYRQELNAEEQEEEERFRKNRRSITESSLFNVKEEKIKEIEKKAYYYWYEKLTEKSKGWAVLVKDVEDFTKYAVEYYLEVVSKSKFIMKVFNVDKNEDADNYMNNKKVKLEEPFDYNYEFIGDKELHRVNNPIYRLKSFFNSEEIWFMGFNYPNFSDMDIDKDKYTAVVVLDEEGVKAARNLALNTGGSSWSVTSKSGYVKDESIVDQLFEEDALELKAKAAIYENWDEKIRIHPSGNLSLYYKNNNKGSYIKLGDLLTGNTGIAKESVNKGHTFDYRKIALDLYTDVDKKARKSLEKTIGIIRGQNFEYGLMGASTNVKDILNNTNNSPKSMNAVIVIETPSELKELYDHLTSDIYKAVL
ncbi:hypothetical protein CACET_c28040 [Clostridium aceticum]|uniref:Uncharacterized protein n=1 Tax=Clostridium aceticum TaxID=84022 RepID=A0A0D8IBQ5_9CLOT|nr:hypothetical protein [Clostridium aceticum]AKL96249.1 hypothetical protein CACET_c28040 [Clostridium aceticum]KJF26656.1 hypothetical protein TZ02_12370 [Clostridium aceticum]